MSWLSQLSNCSNLAARIDETPRFTPKRKPACAWCIQREIPNTARAAEFGGHAMVQSFTVPLPDGQLGRCWATTAEAFRVPRFGRSWVAMALRAHAAR